MCADVGLLRDAADAHAARERQLPEALCQSDHRRPHRELLFGDVQRRQPTTYDGLSEPYTGKYGFHNIGCTGALMDLQILHH